MLSPYYHQQVRVMPHASANHLFFVLFEYEPERSAAVMLIKACLPRSSNPEPSNRPPLHAQKKRTRALSPFFLHACNASFLGGSRKTYRCAGSSSSSAAASAAAPTTGADGSSVADAAAEQREGALLPRRGCPPGSAARARGRSPVTASCAGQLWRGSGRRPCDFSISSGRFWGGCPPPDAALFVDNRGIFDRQR